MKTDSVGPPKTLTADTSHYTPDAETALEFHENSIGDAAYPSFVCGSLNRRQKHGERYDSSMSLDGFVGSDRKHPGTAICEDAELKKWKLDRISKAGAHLMGRVTYEEMSSYWPFSDDPYASPMNAIPKIVFSRTLSDAEATWPETRVARGDLRTEIAGIKAEPGPDVIIWGGGRLAGALAAANLIDEYRLLVQPLVLGRGQALFNQMPEPRRLDFVETIPFPNGVVVQIYRPQLG